MIQLVLLFCDDREVLQLRTYVPLPAERRAGIGRALVERAMRRAPGQGELLDCEDLLGEGSVAAFRRFAGHRAMFCADVAESPLCVLDLIDTYIHALAQLAGGTEEALLELLAHRRADLDLVLDEIVQGGLVLETDLARIVHAARQQQGAAAGASGVRGRIARGLSAFRKRFSK